MSVRTVLVVDDEDDIREVIQMTLEMFAGWTVHTARNGVEAISKVDEVKPELVLMDVMMPEMDGPEAFRRLQANPATSQIPVIFLTAKVQRTEQVDLHDLGACGLISKPFDPMTLSSRIDDLVAAS